MSRPMTVCISAVCENGKSVVVAADRMMTYGPPMLLQTEPPVKKIEQLTISCVLMFSGSVPDGEEIATRVKAKATSSHNPVVSEIAEECKAGYAELKQKRVEETILRPYLGVDFNKFQTLVTQSSASQILGQILGLISQHNLQLDLLVAGIDVTGAHLYGVTHPGILVPLETMGFAAVGSGGTHAAVRLCLAQQTRASALHETVFNVYGAKRSSEIAPGVGRATDMAVILHDRISFLDESELEGLNSVYEEKPALQAKQVDKLKSLGDKYAPKPTK